MPRLSFQLCETLEELLNVNGKLRSEGQAIWTLLGGILGQVLPPSLTPHTLSPVLLSASTTMFSMHRCVMLRTFTECFFPFFSIAIIFDPIQTASGSLHGQQQCDATVCKDHSYSFNLAFADLHVICCKVRPDCEGKCCLPVLVPMATHC